MGGNARGDFVGEEIVEDAARAEDARFVVGVFEIVECGLKSRFNRWLAKGSSGRSSIKSGGTASEEERVCADGVATPYDVVPAWHGHAEVLDHEMKRSADCQEHERNSIERNSVVGRDCGRRVQL